MKIRCTHSKQWHIDYVRSKYRNKTRLGYIVGVNSNDTCYWVIWDNTITKTCYHKSFISIVNTIDTSNPLLLQQLISSEIF